MKIACIYHKVDLDGWMSAAIVKRWFTKNFDHRVECDMLNEIVAYHETENHLHFYGFNYGDVVPDLSSYDKIIICDITLPADVMVTISPKMVWLDHHISAIKNFEMEFKKRKNFPIPDGIRDTVRAACELTWQHFFGFEKPPEIGRLLGMYDSFRHKGTDEEQKVLEFQYGARSIITNYKQAYDSLAYDIHNTSVKTNEYGLSTTTQIIWSEGKTIYRYLKTISKSIYKRGFKLNLMGYNFLCINEERFNPINFDIKYHDDGYEGVATFYYDGNNWYFSLYNDDGKVDVSEIAKHFGGGGHKGASGFITKDISYVINSDLR